MKLGIDAMSGDLGSRIVVEACLSFLEKNKTDELYVVGKIEELEALKPNVVKTYSKSSDLANMFSSGEIVAAISADFAYGTIANVKPEAEYIVPASGTYLNFNTININKNSKNKDLAYEFINYLLSEEVQLRAAENLGDSPVNNKVVLDEAKVGNLTFGATVENGKTIDYKFVNSKMNSWVDSWNRIMNK